MFGGFLAQKVSSTLCGKYGVHTMAASPKTRRIVVNHLQNCQSGMLWWLDNCVSNLLRGSEFLFIVKKV